MAIRVLIVDDSSFFRKRLFDIITADDSLKVIGTADNGLDAIEKARSLKPDIITMDIEMPGLNGIETTKRIMAQSPTAILLLSSTTATAAKATLSGLDAGALAYLPKRLEDVSNQQSIWQTRLCKVLNQLALNYKNRALIQQSPVLAKAKPANLKLDHIKLVVIGTSTGGPVALQAVLSQLPAQFPAPILVVQHMPAAFTPSFAERLDHQCNITVKHAENGDVLRPGSAYIAPGGKQMRLQGSKAQLSVNIKDSQPDDTYQPCVDTTLFSIAKICPDQTLAIILTGMGSDGKKGCEQLKKLDTVVWSQDKQSSTIYGMPMAIAKANLADKVLSLNDIGQQLSAIRH